jgi:hypothetical protein
MDRNNNGQLALLLGSGKDAKRFMLTNQQTFG